MKNTHMKFEIQKEHLMNRKPNNMLGSLVIMICSVFILAGCAGTDGDFSGLQTGQTQDEGGLPIFISVTDPIFVSQGPMAVFGFCGGFEGKLIKLSGDVDPPLARVTPFRVSFAVLTGPLLCINAGTKLSPG